MKRRHVTVMLLFLALLGGGVLAASAAESGRLTGGIRYEIPAWFKTSFLDLAEDAAEAAEADKHVLLFMHLDECPYCEASSPTTRPGCNSDSMPSPSTSAARAKWPSTSR
jgi:thioredoxin-related protein